MDVALRISSIHSAARSNLCLYGCLMHALAATGNGWSDYQSGYNEHMYDPRQGSEYWSQGHQVSQNVVLIMLLPGWYLSCIFHSKNAYCTGHGHIIANEAMWILCRMGMIMMGTLATLPSPFLEDGVGVSPSAITPPTQTTSTVSMHS